LLYFYNSNYEPNSLSLSLFLLSPLSQSADKDFEALLFAFCRLILETVNNTIKAALDDHVNSQRPMDRERERLVSVESHFKTVRHHFFFAQNKDETVEETHQTFFILLFALKVLQCKFGASPFNSSTLFSFVFPSYFVLARPRMQIKTNSSPLPLFRFPPKTRRKKGFV
jgi:hypothetical protein